MPLDPENEYIHLARDGTGQVVPGGEAFWSLPASERTAFEDGWLVAEFTCSEDWNRWEMHPEGDELVYLLSGEVELLLQLPSGTTATHIAERGAVLVPRGVWHTARVMRPSRMLFVTRGAGTQHKPARAFEGRRLIAGGFIPMLGTESEA